MKIPTLQANYPRLTTEQMIEVDRLMIEEYHIELIQMMENAGRCLAIIAQTQFLNDKPQVDKIIVLAGTGGNGGGAMVCARRLHNWGYPVEVFISLEEEHMAPVPKHQLDILKNMGVPVSLAKELKNMPNDEAIQLIIDGIIGYSLSGNPHGSAKDMIDWANAQAAPTLALDTPSGVSLSQGEIFQPVIQAQATLTLALPKVGLFQEAVLPYRGDLFLGDISVPPALYSQPSLGLSLGAIFQEADILEVKE